MRHIWVTCMSLDTQWTLRWKSYGFWSEIKHGLHFNEHFSKINSSLITIPKMTWILFDIINLDGVGYHKLFHKRYGLRGISLPRLLGHLHHTLAKPVIRGYFIHFFNASRKLCDLVWIVAFEEPSLSKTEAITDREICHSPKIVTAHFFLYLVDERITFTTNSRSS